MELHDQMQDALPGVHGFVSDVCTSSEYSHVEVHDMNDLDVAITNDIVWFWSFGKWQSASNEQWAWKYLTVVEDNTSARQQL